jgi:type II secretory pathway component PulJ
MLFELLIAVAFVGSLGALVSVTMFQTMKTDAHTSTRIKVADQKARASRWLSRDGHRASATDILDGGSAVAQATFTWDESGTPVSCAYAVSQARLIRTCNGSPATVGVGITNLSFTRSGRLITVAFDVVESGQTDPVSLNVLLGGR